MPRISKEVAPEVERIKAEVGQLAFLLRCQANALGSVKGCKGMFSGLSKIAARLEKWQTK